MTLRVTRAVTRARLAALGLAGLACGARSPGRAATDRGAEVVATFERAVLAGPDAYAALFDFAAVGKVEKLLHRYDALGRADLPDAWRDEFLAETPEPFSVERERTNLGKFFPPLAQRTVGTGGCAVAAPASAYARLLGGPFEPLPAEHQAYEPLRGEVNALFARGGLVTLACTGGQGQLALVWTDDASPRGWSLVTMYDDVAPGTAAAPNPCAPR